MTKLLTILFSFSLIGCISTGPTIQTTKTWEKHYFTVEEFYNGTKNITLEKNESIWVISNKTLSKILKKYIEKSEN